MSAARVATASFPAIVRLSMRDGMIRIPGLALPLVQRCLTVSAAPRTSRIVAPDGTSAMSQTAIEAPKAAPTAPSASTMTKSASRARGCPSPRWQPRRWFRRALSRPGRTTARCGRRLWHVGPDLHPTTTTRRPRRASSAPRMMAVVVLPTTPFDCTSPMMATARTLYRHVFMVFQARYPQDAATRPREQAGAFEGLYRLGDGRAGA